MCQDQNLPEVRLPPIQQSLWECGKEVNTCTNRNTTEGTFKTHCKARDLRRSSVRSIYLLTGSLTGPRGAQPVNYQTPLAALTGILKTSLLMVNPGLGQEGGGGTHRELQFCSLYSPPPRRKSKPSSGRRKWIPHAQQSGADTS